MTARVKVRQRPQSSVPSPRDPMFAVEGQPPLPLKFDQIRDGQWAATEKIVAEYERGAKVVFVAAPTGCLSGDTIIQAHRAGRGFKITLQDLYEKFHGRMDMGKSWDRLVPTRVAQGDMESMTVRSSQIADVSYSGLKSTVVVYVWDGKALRMTQDHRVMTENGWAQIGDLGPGTPILVNVGRRKRTSNKSKPSYPQVCGMKGHPRATRPHPHGGYKVPRHILVAEADINDMSYEDYIAALREGRSDFLFVPSDHHVHHINEDSTDFRLENLKILTAEDHYRHHGDFSRVGEQLGFRAINRMTTGGNCMTFDIEMAEGGSHFMAEGVFAHNSGKSLLAELVRRRLDVRAGLYVCTTKSLQQQFAREFDYARVLKGMVNYTPTGVSWRDEEVARRHNFARVTCGDCDRGPRDAHLDDQTCSHCEWVSECPYLVAKREALAAPVGVLNTAYALAEWNNVGNWGRRKLVVADEADLLEQQLMGYVELRLPTRLAERLGLDVPKKGSHLKTIRGWLEEDVLVKLEQARVDLLRSKDVESARERSRIERLIGQVGKVVKREDGWVRDNDAEDDRSPDSLVLKPISVEDVGDEYLWKHGERWLCMSGTMHGGIEAEKLGLEEAGIEWAEVKMPMEFDVENRRVVYVPAGVMTRKEEERGKPRVLRALEVILQRHPGVNVLVHCHTYRLAKETVEWIKQSEETRPVITYLTARDRDFALQNFTARSDKGGAVLVAASMDRGIDLPDDDCRVQVILKVPMASLGDRQVSERMRQPGGQLWYLHGTCSTIMQMTGRAVRSADDHAITYILDGYFSKVYADGKKMGLWPEWWRNGLETARVGEYR